VTDMRDNGSMGRSLSGAESIADELMNKLVIEESEN